MDHIPNGTVGLARATIYSMYQQHFLPHHLSNVKGWSENTKCIHCGFALCEPLARLNIKTVFLGMNISIMRVRQSWDRLVFIVGMSILVRRHLYIETITMCPDVPCLMPRLHLTCGVFETAIWRPQFCKPYGDLTVLVTFLLQKPNPPPPPPAHPHLIRSASSTAGWSHGALAMA